MTTARQYMPWVDWGLEGGEAIYRNITMPMVHALQEIEHNGVLIDQDKLSFLDEQYRDKIAAAEQEFWNVAGSEVSYTSAQQLQKFLYTDLQLPVVLTTKKGAPSTALPALAKLKSEHPVVETLYDLKKLVKIKKDFLGGWGKSRGLIQWVQDDGRIHTNYRVDGTESGRLSTGDPNTQNIAKVEEIRSMFVPPPGMVFGEVDYSQLELNIAARLSGDEKMAMAIALGMHEQTAAFMFNVPVEKVTYDMRNKAKTINFLVLYGGGAYTLAFRLDITIEEAEKYLAAWFKAYKKVYQWIRKTQWEAQKRGYVDSVWMRRRHLPELKTPNRADPQWKKRHSHLKRVSVNFPIQSAGSDSLSMSTIKLLLYPDDALLKMGVRFTMTLHDALFFEVPERHAVEAGARVQEVMKRVPRFCLGSDWALESDVKLGRYWGDNSVSHPGGKLAA